MKRPRSADETLNALTRAIALHNSGRIDDADAIYVKVLREQPRHADALHLRALAFHARGDHAQSARFAEMAIAVAPQVANFHNTAGNALRLLGRLAQAKARLLRAVQLAPGLAMARHNLALVYEALGDLAGAKSANAQALARDPDHCDALVHALNLAVRENDGAAADLVAPTMDRWRDRPEVAQALGRYQAMRARGLAAQGDVAAAREHAAAALRAIPESADAWLAHGLLHEAQQHDDEAELALTIAANLAPASAAARLNVARLLREQKRLDEARSHYAAWLAAKPDSADARFGLAWIALASGDFANGWKDYEARWELSDNPSPRFIGAPEWDGGPTGALLLYSEQGLGDTVQMLRFVPEVLTRGVVRVMLLVPPPLERLARTVASDPRLFVVNELPANARFDAACALLSLPRVLRANTREQLSMSAPYLGVDAARQARFRARLSPLRGRKLGLVWKGGKAGSANLRRAVPEEALLPLLDRDGWTAVSLQVGSEAMIAGRAVFDLAADIADFADLATAMACMDAIVCVDTGPAHLAGALGLECYTLVPWLHDWRWGNASTRTYWYPSMTLVRQHHGEAWDGIVADLVRALDHGSDVRERPTVPAARTIERSEFPFVWVRGRFGSVKLPLFDRYITRSLLAYGEYSRREAEVLFRYLRAGDTAVDVGANVGALTLPLARAVGPSGHLIAFEPQAAIFDCLAETVRRNELHWVEARRQAVGARAGEATIPRIDPATPHNFGGVAIADDAAGDCVGLTTLDALHLDACRLIKIDVEGREADVLRGAARTIARCRPILCVECDRPGAREAIARLLRPLGYAIWLHEPPLFSPDNFRNCGVDLFPALVSGNLLALPAGELPPGDARRI